jgi:hypothetical protein
MFNASSYEERAKVATPEQYKAMVYGNTDWAILYIESDDNQAQEIARLTHKPVFCYDTGKMYKDM